MTSERDAVLELVRRRASGRPVRWVDSRTSAGDFDGHEWTVEIFDVAKSDRRALREALWDLFAEARRNTGRTLSLLTHTPEDTTRLYAWVRTELNRDTALVGVPRGGALRGLSRDLIVTPHQHIRPRAA